MDKKQKERVLLPEGLSAIRTGTCQPNKCKSACCKFFMVSYSSSLEEYGEYYKGFFNNSTKFGDLYLIKDCNHLDAKLNKCKLWGSEEFPEVCKVFPAITDPAYRHCIDKCTFKFIVREDK